MIPSDILRPSIQHRRKSITLNVAFRHLVVWPAMLIGISTAAIGAGKDLPASAALDLYKKGQFENAASVGLTDLLVQPWNLELRFAVADSLQRMGKIDEATTQLEALDGTAYSKTANARLQALRADAKAPTPAVSPGTTNKPISTVDPTPLRVAGTSGIGIQQLSQFQYVSPSGAIISSDVRQPIGSPPAATSASAPNAGPQRSPVAQRVAELNAAEKYQEAGTAGLLLLAAEKPDEDLQLVIGNCLAWTGRLNDALIVYQGLTNGKLSREANIGMANVRRWQGQDAKAVPIYRTVLAADPTNASAQEGLTLAMRELRPRTTLSVGGSIDSSEMQRRSATLNHRWRDASGATIMEVETSLVKDKLPPNEARQQDVTVRYSATELALKPSLELSIPANADHKLYGSARIKLGENDNIVEVGRVDWGKIATNPTALAANLSATHIGLEASEDFSFGKIGGRFDYYNISDGNTIVSGGVRLASNWRPLGSHIKPFVGIDMRNAKFNTPTYWSPATGFGSFYAGLLAEWGSADWNFYASGQAGTRMFGEAGTTSWSASAGGKRWVTNELALSFNLWKLSSQRDNAAYRSQSVNVNLERLW